MSLITDFTDQLKPHVTTLGRQLNQHGMLIHARLKSIDDRISDLGRPDTGDKWLRLSLGGVQKSGERVEIATVPRNEIWLLQAVTNALREGTTYSSLYASTHFICQVENAPTLLTPGGDIAFLPGEKVEIEVGENEKECGLTLHIIRRQIPGARQNPNLGPKGERLSVVNTHDPNRDEIMAEPGPYQEIPGPIEDDTGAPPLVLDPTSV